MAGFAALQPLKAVGRLEDLQTLFSPENEAKTWPRPLEASHLMEEIPELHGCKEQKRPKHGRAEAK